SVAFLYRKRGDLNGPGRSHRARALRGAIPAGPARRLHGAALGRAERAGERADDPELRVEREALRARRSFRGAPGRRRAEVGAGPPALAAGRGWTLVRRPRGRLDPRVGVRAPHARAGTRRRTARAEGVRAPSTNPARRRGLDALSRRPDRGRRVREGVLRAE